MNDDLMQLLNFLRVLSHGGEGFSPSGLGSLGQLGYPTTSSGGLGGFLGEPYSGLGSMPGMGLQALGGATQFPSDSHGAFDGSYASMDNNGGNHAQGSFSFLPSIFGQPWGSWK